MGRQRLVAFVINVLEMFLLTYLEHNISKTTGVRCRL